MCLRSHHPWRLQGVESVSFVTKEWYQRSGQRKVTGTCHVKSCDLRYKEVPRPDHPRRPGNVRGREVGLTRRGSETDRRNRHRESRLEDPVRSLSGGDERQGLSGVTGTVRRVST